MEIELLIFIFLIFISIPLSFFYLIPFIFGAPYEQSRKKQIETILEFSKNSKYVAELGSGNGKIAIELAKRGVFVDGYEINPFLVIYSKRKIKKLKLENKIKIVWGNFFDYNLSKYDTIVMFQFSTIMNKLKNKFDKELKNKTKIISNYWKLPKSNPIKQKNKINLYIKNTPNLKRKKY